MKRFSFAYANLLNVKQQREKLAERRVAEASRERDAWRARLASLVEALHDVARQLEQSVGASLQGPVWAGTFEQATHLERAIRHAEGRVASAEEARRQALEERTRLSVEVEMLETLQKKRREEFRQELQQAEQERLDELGLRRWREARRPFQE